VQQIETQQPQTVKHNSPSLVPPWFLASGWESGEEALPPATQY